MIELQSHSVISDGQLEPAGVVEEAAKAGVEVLALTDHDGVAGVPEAVEAGERLGVEIVPAVEMSSVHKYAEDLHICGYWVDVEKITPACERAQEERRTRAKKIIQNLRDHGFDVTFEDAVREAGAADAIGRPHIAKAAGATDAQKICKNLPVISQWLPGYEVVNWFAVFGPRGDVFGSGRGTEWVGSVPTGEPIHLVVFVPGFAARVVPRDRTSTDVERLTLTRTTGRATVSAVGRPDLILSGDLRYEYWAGLPTPRRVLATTSPSVPGMGSVVTNRFGRKSRSQRWLPATKVRVPLAWSVGSRGTQNVHMASPAAWK